MNLKKIVLSLVAALALAQAAYLTWAYMQQDDDLLENQGTEFLCLTEGCGAEFFLSRGEMVEVVNNHEGVVTCPQCKKAFTRQAVRCGSCKSNVPLVGHGSYPENCPKCKQPISISPAGPMDESLLCNTDEPAPGGTAVEVAERK
jgi:uncharacterized protein YbaR (Trm112 family)